MIVHQYNNWSVKPTELLFFKLQMRNRNSAITASASTHQTLHQERKMPDVRERETTSDWSVV